MRILNLFYFAVVMSLLITCQAPTATITLDADDFEKMLEQTPNPQLIDVRTLSEYAQGYLSGAILIDVRKPSFESLIQQLDATRPIFVYCRLGRRSLEAAKILEKNKFVTVYNLEGGIVEWNEKGKAIKFFH